MCASGGKRSCRCVLFSRKTPHLPPAGPSVSVPSYDYYPELGGVYPAPARVALPSTAVSATVIPLPRPRPFPPTSVSRYLWSHPLWLQNGAWKWGARGGVGWVSLMQSRWWGAAARPLAIAGAVYLPRSCVGGERVACCTHLWRTFV